MTESEYRRNEKGAKINENNIAYVAHLLALLMFRVLTVCGFPFYFFLLIHSLHFKIEFVSVFIVSTLVDGIVALFVCSNTDSLIMCQYQNDSHVIRHYYSFISVSFLCRFTVAAGCTTFFSLNLTLHYLSFKPVLSLKTLQIKRNSVHNTLNSKFKANSNENGNTHTKKTNYEKCEKWRKNQQEIASKISQITHTERMNVCVCHLFRAAFHVMPVT